MDGPQGELLLLTQVFIKKSAAVVVPRVPRSIRPKMDPNDWCVDGGGRKRGAGRGCVPHAQPESLCGPRCRVVDIVALGLRNLASYNFMPIYMPFIEFDVGDRGHAHVTKSTQPSKKPSGTNPNFVERIRIPIKLPVNALCVTPPRSHVVAPPLRFRSCRLRVVGS